MTPQLQSKYTEFQKFVAKQVGDMLAKSMLNPDGTIRDAKEIQDEAERVRASIKCAVTQFDYEELVELLTHNELKNLERERNYATVMSKKVKGE